MALVIEAVMLAAGAFMMLFCKPDVKKIVKSPVMEACVVSITCVFGVAWMSDSFIAANKDVFMQVAGSLAQVAPWLFTFIWPVCQLFWPARALQLVPLCL